MKTDQSFALTNPGQRTALQQQINNYRTQNDLYQREQANLQRELAERRLPEPPVLPPLTVKESPQTQRAPLPHRSHVNFVLQIALQPQSVVPFFIFMILPIIVEGGLRLGKKRDAGIWRNGALGL